MPSLTLQAAGTGQPESGEQREPSPPEPEPRQERDGRREETEGAGRTERRGGGPAAGRLGERTRAGRGLSPPAGRDTPTLYPDLTVKTLAPRIDATRREEGRRDVTQRAREEEQGPSGRERDLDDLLSGGGIDAGPSPAQIDRLVEKLHREIERKMRIERERRGL